MAHPQQVKNAARAAYIHERLSIEQTARQFGLAPSTIFRWKNAAKSSGDDWDNLRSASLLTGDGLESAARKTLASYLQQHAALMEELNADDTTPAEKKVTLLASLANSFAKTVEASKRALPETNELVIALEVINFLSQFVQEKFPQHQHAFLEILEPFGNVIAQHLSRKNK